MCEPDGKSFGDLFLNHEQQYLCDCGDSNDIFIYVTFNLQSMKTSNLVCFP